MSNLCYVLSHLIFFGFPAWLQYFADTVRGHTVSWADVIKDLSPPPTDSRSIERVIHSILTCRVVLHIREQGEIEKRSNMTSDKMTGPICFAHTTQRATDISEEFNH